MTDGFTREVLPTACWPVPVATDDFSAGFSACLSTETSAAFTHGFSAAADFSAHRPAAAVFPAGFSAAVFSDFACGGQRPAAAAAVGLTATSFFASPARVPCGDGWTDSVLAEDSLVFLVPSAAAAAAAAAFERVRPPLTHGRNEAAREATVFARPLAAAAEEPSSVLWLESAWVFGVVEVFAAAAHPGVDFTDT